MVKALYSNSIQFVNVFEDCFIFLCIIVLVLFVCLFFGDERDLGYQATLIYLCTSIILSWEM